MSTKRLLFSFVFFAFLNVCFSQKEQCESSEKTMDDLNSINKCAIEKWEDANNKNKRATKQLAIRLTTRRHVRRSYKIERKKEASSLALIKSNDINSISVKNDVAKIVDVKKATELDDSVILPFSMVNVKPTFDKCKEENTEKCFNTEIVKHIKKHFTYPEEAYDKGLEGKVMVRFKINKYGEVTDIKANTDYEKESLKLEAERIVAELPNFSPAKHTNKLVNVSYGIPIVFKISDKDRVRKKTKEIANAVSFDDVDEVPVFNSCAETTNEDMAKCFNTEMVKHIQNNFSYPRLAAEKNITGKVWVNFIVDTKGEIKNIKLRGGDYILKTEAKRIISLLPKLKSGKNNGKKVNTKYVLPINFVLTNS